MTSDWRPPNKHNRETANIGLVSSVGRAPARQSGGDRFKSLSTVNFLCSSKIYIHKRKKKLVRREMNTNEADIKSRVRDWSWDWTKVGIKYE